MADALYTVAKESFLNGSIDMTTADIRACLVDSDYTYSAAHATMGAIITGAVSRIGTDQELGVIAVTGGKVIVTGDSTWSAVTAGATVKAIIVYKFVTNDAGSIPIAYIDSPANLPLATNGGDITVAWDDSNGIFYL